MRAPRACRALGGLQLCAAGAPSPINCSPLRREACLVDPPAAAGAAAAAPSKAPPSLLQAALQCVGGGKCAVGLDAARRAGFCTCTAGMPHHLHPMCCFPVPSCPTSVPHLPFIPRRFSRSASAAMAWSQLWRAAQQPCGWHWCCRTAFGRGGTAGQPPLPPHSSSRTWRPCPRPAVRMGSSRASSKSSSMSATGSGCSTSWAGRTGL